jgi:SAM-dependent methyltransferase
MARAYPASEFVGFDYHPESIERARELAEEEGLSDRVSFEVASAQDFPGSYDLVCNFDCLHDMGDPVGAARHTAEALNPGGTYFIVEPNAGDALTDNVNPVGRMFYGASTLICTPASQAQDVGLALGAQAGESRLADVLREGGFKTVKRATETPFNIVLEARA